MEIPIDNIIIPIIIGTSAKHNTEIVSEANDNDLWFHVSDKPSAHVIAKISGISLTKKQRKKIIIKCCNLSKAISKYSSEKQLEITYTEIKHIQITDVPGAVNLLEYKTFIA